MATGRVEQRSWANEAGEKRTSVEVVADDIGPSLRWTHADLERASATAWPRQPERSFGAAGLSPAAPSGHTTGQSPPSTLMAVPVRYDAASEARKHARLANSSGSPMRPSGTRRCSSNGLASTLHMMFVLRYTQTLGFFYASASRSSISSVEGVTDIQIS